MWENVTQRHNSLEVCMDASILYALYFSVYLPEEIWNLINSSYC